MEGNKNVTPVVHYFAKEWVKLNHKVAVIHTVTEYPPLFYKLPKKLYKFIESVIGSSIQFVRLAEKDYLLDGVSVFRLPIRKNKPYGDFSEKGIKEEYNKIITKLNSIDFIPDVVIGHWESPQILLVHLLKQKYKAKSVIVLHSLLYLNKNNKQNQYVQLLREIDVIGFRSLALRNKFHKDFWSPKKDFICYSGIPIDNAFIPHKKTFSEKLSSILYVGMLIKRKFPDKLLSAYVTYMKQNSGTATLKYIGEGALLRGLENSACRSSFKTFITFYGRISRENVFNMMQETECFVMISQQEAFGLVYLEAMLQGCLVIASKNEGMDGIIIDGENGFLCEAGNEKELLSTFERIDKLPAQEKMRISANAVETAMSFSEAKAAQSYLKAIKM